MHEFRTENMNEANRTKNGEDFGAFVALLCDLPGDEGYARTTLWSGDSRAG